MQRKFLEELGLEKDIIDKIMKEHGATVESQKTRLEGERDNYKNLLETAQKSLEAFEGVDVNELKGQISTLKTDLANKEAAHQKEIADIQFGNVLDESISNFGGRNSKAIKALLDVENLKQSKNQAEDIKTALENLKADNDYLFNSNEPIKNPVKDTGNPPPIVSDTVRAMRQAMGLPEQNK